MNINIIQSGSQGNAVLLSHNGYHLLLDVGVKIDKLRKSLIDSNVRLTHINGALISHSHGDHSSRVKDLCQIGIDCYMAKETAAAINFNNHRLRVIEAHKQFSIGPWTILPFDLIHDVPNLGFLIAIDDKCVLYAVDMSYVPVLINGEENNGEMGLIQYYGFNPLTHILIECNYKLEALREMDDFLKYRIMKNHMNIETVKNFLIDNDISKIEEIYLLHISKQNGDPEKFKEEIQRLTGKVVKT